MCFEIAWDVLFLKYMLVTPYAGVWIEIDNKEGLRTALESLPTRECGLKFDLSKQGWDDVSHSLRGSVD